MHTKESVLAVGDESSLREVWARHIATESSPTKDEIAHLALKRDLVNDIWNEDCNI